MGTIVDNKVSEVAMSAVDVEFTDAFVPDVNNKLDEDYDAYSTSNENSNSSAVCDKNENIDTENVNLSRKHKTLRIVDSDDSESEIPSNLKSERSVKEIFKSKEQLNCNIDSDEDEHNSKRLITSNLDSVDSDNDTENKTENEELLVVKRSFKSVEPNDFENNYKPKKSKIPDLFDSDSSGEEDTTRNNTNKKLQKNAKPKKMTAKDAKDQRHLITSESQRMLRESSVSLPYHKPKPRTLKEFMSKRPKISEPLPESTKMLSPIIAMKVTQNQINIFSKKLEEREKFVEEFYKSDNESEEEENTPEVDENETKENAKKTTEENKTSTNNSEDSNNTNVVETGVDKENETETSQQNSDEQQSTEKNSISDNDNCLKEDSNNTNIVENCTVTENVDEICKMSETNSTDQKSTEEKKNTTENNLKEDSNDEIAVENSIVIENKKEVSKTSEENSSDQKLIEEKQNTIKNSLEDDSNKTHIAENQNQIRKTKNSENKNIYKPYLENIENISDDDNEEHGMDIPKTSQENENTIKSYMANVENISDAEDDYDTETPEENMNQNNENVTRIYSVPMKDLLKNMDKIEYFKFQTDLLNSFINPSRLGKYLGKINSSKDNLKSITIENNSESQKNSVNLSQSIPKLTDSQLEDMNKKYTDTAEDSLFSNKRMFAELDDSDNEKEHNEVEVPKKDSLMKSSVFQIGNLKPRLSGAPNETIDLTEDVEKTGLQHLMKRFMNNVTHKPSTPKSVEMSVLISEGNKIREDKVTVSVKTQDDSSQRGMYERPGAKLVQLRGDLKQQIAKQREIQWKKKEQEEKELRGELENDDEEDDFESVYHGEKDDCCSNSNENKDENDPLELDENEEEEESETEEENEEDLDDKPRKVKSAFVDDEAEVSDSEEEEEETVDYENETNVDSDKEDDQMRPVKKLRRIKSFAEDSESDTEIEEMKLSAVQTMDKEMDSLERVSKISTMQKTRSEVDLFATQDADNNNSRFSDISDYDEEIIPARQPNTEKTPDVNRNKSYEIQEASFVSPILRLTALQNMPSGKKNESTDDNICLSMSDPSPLKSSICNGDVPKRLFIEPEIPDTQENLDQLVGLCSGKFVDSTQKTNLEMTQSQDLDIDVSLELPEDSQNNIIPEATSSKNAITNEDDDSQNIKLIWLDHSDDELKNIKTQSQKNPATPEPTRVDKFVIASSSDEENDEDIKKKKRKSTTKKRRHKVLSFSDAENSTESEKSDDDLDKEDMVVDYDSEENEVVRPLQQAEKKLRARDFLENEAELSESDWGSADEDERDLDKLEEEDGDADIIDEKKVQNELERIHMRKMMDDDSHKVRLLQELLLEDGELHSENGRQRQFKWKNIDKLDEENIPPSNVDSDNDKSEDDEEAEAQWRRNRFERENFLREEKEKLVKKMNGKDLHEIELENDSNSIIKLGAAFIKKNVTVVHTKTSNTNNSLYMKKTNIMSFDVESSMNFTNKRGSILARGENALARIAAITKDTEITLNGAKNGKNFVFTAIDRPTEKEVLNGTEASDSNKKRKASSSGTPALVKKLKINEKLASVGNGRAKKLFDAL